MKKYSHGPVDTSKTLKLRLGEGDLELPDRQKGEVPGIPVAWRRRK